MSAEKTTAIVLRVVDFSESSCVVTMMTSDFGKITAIAKGARRRKSPFEGALDLLSISRIVFLHKRSDALDLLTEAKLERRFRSAERDLDRLYAGYYVIELLAAMVDDSDPHPDLYRLAEQTLQDLDHGLDLVKNLIRFEIGALVLLGHGPMLDQCVGCGRKKSKVTSRVPFGLNTGGILCPSCRKGKTKVVSLSEAAWKALLQFSDLKNDDVELPAGAGEIRQFMNHYIAHHIGHRPRLQSYITEIKN